jgi:enterochelin esterase-like enzyme
MIRKQLPILIVLSGLIFVGCEPIPLAMPTPEVIIITAVPSATPLPTPTEAPTRTPIPTLTPVNSPTPTPPPCEEETGQIVKIERFESVIAQENMRYWVYVPPCYTKTQRRYPVVWLIHGAAAREDQWETLGALTAADQGFRLGALPPMILVMPYVGSIGTNSTFPPDPAFESVVIEELLPALDRDFCTYANRDYRAIGGISRGGFWAYSIGLRHPDVFGIIGGHSAYFTEDLSEIPAPFNPLDLASNDANLPTNRQRLYIDNGAQDPSGRMIENFSTRLTERNIPHTYIINPVGDHDEQYWSAHVTEYLAFYGRNWPRNADELPSCLEPSP